MAPEDVLLPNAMSDQAGQALTSGGLSLATGLQKYPQLDVHVYEGTKLY